MFCDVASIFTVCGFVADFLVQPLQRNMSDMSRDIYHNNRKLCNDVFCRKEMLHFALVSLPPNLVSFGTWNCNSHVNQYTVYLGKSGIGRNFIVKSQLFNYVDHGLWSKQQSKSQSACIEKGLSLDHKGHARVVRTLIKNYG